jgi:hypothetical protein
MLGNGLCTRPAELDCRMESACETCAYFRTGTEFLPILVRRATTPATTDSPTGPPCSTGSSSAPIPDATTGRS